MIKYSLVVATNAAELATYIVEKGKPLVKVIDTNAQK
jgi:hypothetical protein